MFVEDSPRGRCSPSAPGVPCAIASGGLRNYKDPTNQIVEVDLKKVHSLVSFAFCSVIALNSVSKALKVWVSNVETNLNVRMDPARIITTLEELSLVVDFLTESLIDLTRVLAKIVAHSIKGALWLYHWVADVAFK